MEPKPHPNPGIDANCFVKACIKLNNSHKFELFIVGAILLNTCVLASNFYTMTQELVNVLEGLNLTFMAIFAIEAFIKITAMRRAYFKDTWNQFDFIIIVSSIIFLVPVSMGSLVEY